jgi:hypothetical protein
MGVATGTSIQLTNFQVPIGIETGKAELCVIANGIASECVPVYVGKFSLHFPVDAEMVNTLIGSLADGPLWVLGPNGPVPVDPMAKDEQTKKIAQEATHLRAIIIQNVRALQSLGRQFATNRAAVAGTVPPAVETDEAAENVIPTPPPINTDNKKAAKRSKQ